MFTVYIITSFDKDFTYVGMTNNLERRFRDHNAGYNKSTKFYAPFKLIYEEHYQDRKSARKREKYLKSHAGKIFLKKYFSVKKEEGKL